MQSSSLATRPRLLISVISHEHGHLVGTLVNDLLRLDYSTFSSVTLVLTKNAPEELHVPLSASDFQIRVVENSAALGFGQNHNNAFELVDSDYFLVLNPDVRLSQSFSFSDMLDSMKCGLDIVSPLIFSSSGALEDSFRKFPSVFSLLRRHFLRRKLDYAPGDVSTNAPFSVDWIAGMFMLFRSPSYSAVEGFDTKFFMYLEDADICRRIRRNLRGEVGVVSSQRVIHDAARRTFKNRKHLVWHVKSMFRFLFDV